MKTLSIQQPWASLICAGIKDVENRTWKPSDVPGRILIHAGAKRVPGNFLNTIPLDWMVAMQQDQLFGNMPAFEEMPLSAIIGYATVTGFADTTDSLWDGGEGQIKWQLEDMYLFDEPITGVKGRLGLFDYPLDEDHLPPAHKVDLKYPSLVDGVLTMPVAGDVFDAVRKGAEAFEVDLDPSLVSEIADEDGELLPIGMVRFECGDKAFVCDAGSPCVYDHVDVRTGSPVVEKNYRGEDVPWQYLSVLLGNPRPSAG